MRIIDLHSAVISVLFSFGPSVRKVVDFFVSFGTKFKHTGGKSSFCARCVGVKVK
jgi:hypothetical protein